MKKMKNRFIKHRGTKCVTVVLAACLLMTMVAGCTLADPDAAQRWDDQLVGVFVTTSKLGDDFESTDEIYGKPELDGNGDMVSIDFGVEGLGMYESPVYEEDGSLRSMSSTQDQGVENVNHSVGDFQGGNTLEGDFYFENNPERIYFANSVYRTSEGKYYMVPAASGVSFSGEDGEEGDFTGEGQTAISQTYDESQDKNWNVKFVCNLKFVK